jgi:hypothetical protein
MNTDVIEDLQAEFAYARREIVLARQAVIMRDCQRNREALDLAYEEMDAVLDMANGERDCE